MTNNLRKIKQDLCSFAKRAKDFKYTDSALISFLITGMVFTTKSLVAASADTSIENQKQTITTSIKSLHQQVNATRRENNKLLKDTNLELIKLMEQGDHVVKSPWSSWQFGMNYFYGDWHGHYKGRGDKVDDVIYQRDNTMAKYKYNSSSLHQLYGSTTELGGVTEPNAAIPVSASLTPLVPKVKEANLSLGVDISDLPSFEPRTVSAPSAPHIEPLGEINAPSFSLDARSIGNWKEVYYDSASNPLDSGDSGHGIIEAVAITKGNFIASRESDSGWFGVWRYRYTGYEVRNAFNTAYNMQSDNPSSPPALSAGQSTGPLNRSSYVTSAPKTGFLRMVSDSGGSTMLNMGNFMYTRKPGGEDFVKELVHLDIHDAQTFDTEAAKLENVVSKNSPEYTAFQDVKAIASATTGSNNSQTFINGGKVIIEGGLSAFSNSYDHIDGAKDNYVSSVINSIGICKSKY